MKRTTIIFFSLVYAVIAMATTDPFAGPIPKFQENVHYRTEFPDNKASQPTVVQFFSFGCPHCFHAEPQVERWLRNKPANIHFERIPVSFGRPSWGLFARAYYIAKALKIEDRFVPAFFNRIHIKRQAPTNLNELKAVFVEMGVKAEDFDKHAKSFWVESQLRRADQLARQYRVMGVPDFLVNYRYRLVPGAVKSEAEFQELLNGLALKDFK